ncbi:RRP5 [Sanghuangporus vaninii]
MGSKKRSSESASTGQRKKAKTSDKTEDRLQPVSVLQREEVDFPRGGGTSFTPVEYKSIRAEALKELNDEEVFKESGARNKPTKKRKSDIGSQKKGSVTQQKLKSMAPRVEHLNYKRIVPGMKLLCQIVAVYPFILIVSLPDQLLGHVPITHISSQLTSALEAADAESLVGGDSDTEEDTLDDRGPPDLTELFRTGQYVRAVVTAVRPSGTTDGHVFGHHRDELEKASRRVELSLIPEQVHVGLAKTDLVKGFTLCAAVKAVEDHGYVLDIGLPGISGFLRHKKDGEPQKSRMRIGSLVNVVTERFGEDGRTCLFTENENEFKASVLSEITNVSSLLPGALVRALVTATVPSGLVVQLLGSFDGTIDLYHLSSGSSPSDFNVGKKIKARILYNVAGSSPPQFALSLNEHVISLDSIRRKTENQRSIQESFPIGTIVESVEVKRVEPERGLVVAVEAGVGGFVHISHVSDEHVPSLSSNSGPWKVHSVHRARVTGFHALDGILQLSLRPSVLSQKFLRVEDVNVGELVKGTVKKLTDSCLFVSINGNIDAMIWPNHYADIMLKHPQKRFKQGSSLKCRVLAVDPDRKRIMLTAKKTLIESDLPIISKIEDVEAGMFAYGVVCKANEKSLVVEFYNHIRGVVPIKEVGDTPITSLAESYPIGKPVKVYVLSVDRAEARIVASIRQAIEGQSPVGDIKSVEIGQTVSGMVREVRGDNVLLLLDPSQARALISLHNVANNRRKTVEQLRSSLTSGEKMEGLVVVSRNLDKGIVIVANRPSQKSQPSSRARLDLRSLSIGSVVTGRISKHGRHGAVVKFPGKVTGILHLTDMKDDFEQGIIPLAVDSSVTAAVIAIDSNAKRLTLSTRRSRLEPTAEYSVVDPEVSGIQDLKVGQKLRGFIKSITDHGIFVTIGRGVDARVQIKELYEKYVKDWKSGLQVNQAVTGHILSIDHEKQQVEMSLRETSSATSEKLKSFADLAVGQKIVGKVKKIEDYGIFVSIEGTKLSGLCHKSEIADNREADIAVALHNFRDGDPVKAIILAIDNEQRRVSLGLKPSYFSEDLDSHVENIEVKSDTDNDTNEKVPMQQASSDNLGQDRKDGEDVETVVIDPALLDASNSIEIGSPEQAALPLAPVLPSQGFQWTKEDEPANRDGESSSEESDEGLEKKRKKKKKKIEHDLTAEMQTRTPESVADFERHLLASPNSSFLWIQYMSFQLQLAEIDKAREIGRRALQAISIREEREKLNVWIALLNLENTYGTEESLEALFKDAARHNDAKTVSLRLANILDQSGKPEKAEEQYKRTCKKFGGSSKVWTLFGEHYLRRGLLEESRKLLSRSLLSLEKRKHLKTIAKFAQLEYKFGDPERGKTIFEGIIDSHPKRWDLWAIYMDMEAGQKDIQSIRNLFDRVFTRKMTNHKAKAFFKKWLELERRIGDEEGQEIVKEKAVEWTRQTANTTA